MTDKNRIPSYWFVQSGEETTGPTYVVGRGDEEITHSYLFRYEAQAIVDALNSLRNTTGENNG